MRFSGLFYIVEHLNKKEKLKWTISYNWYDGDFNLV